MLGIRRLQVRGFCQLAAAHRARIRLRKRPEQTLSVSIGRSIVDAMKLDDAAKFAAANAVIETLRARCEVDSLARPTSLLRCFDADNGDLDLTELSHHMMKQADAVDNKLYGILFRNPQDDEDAGGGDEETPLKKRRKRRPILARRNEDGELEAITPRDSWWHMLYVDCPMLDDDRFHKKFRRRFRLPYEQYRELVNDAVEGNWFPRWMKEESSPIDLLILGSLRYLGRGFTFDDCEENTAISEEVHRVFFHQVSTHIRISFLHCSPCASMVQLIESSFCLLFSS